MFLVNGKMIKLHIIWCQFDKQSGQGQVIVVVYLRNNSFYLQKNT